MMAPMSQNESVSALSSNAPLRHTIAFAAPGDSDDDDDEDNDEEDEDGEALE